MPTQKLPEKDEELGCGPGARQDVGRLEPTPQTQRPAGTSGYYAQIPGVLRVLDIDYDKAVTFYRRLIALYVVYILLCIALAVLNYDASPLFALYVVLILVLLRALYLVRITMRLYAGRSIHMAITSLGVRQDVGRANATTSTVTIFHRFSNMKSVSIGNLSWAVACLTPRGLRLLHLPLRLGRPFQAIGIMDNDEKEVELLIQQKIDLFAKAKLPTATAEDEESETILSTMTSV